MRFLRATTTPVRRPADIRLMPIIARHDRLLIYYSTFAAAERHVTLMRTMRCGDMPRARRRSRLFSFTCRQPPLTPFAVCRRHTSTSRQI